MPRLVTTMISREAIANALRFWEPARVLFNVVLLAYGLVRFWEPLLPLPHKLWTEIVAVAVLANFIYVIAYPIDLTLQATDYRHMWQTAGRPVLWIILLTTGLTLLHITLRHMLRGA